MEVGVADRRRVFWIREFLHVVVAVAARDLESASLERKDLGLGAYKSIWPIERQFCAIALCRADEKANRDTQRVTWDLETPFPEGFEGYCAVAGDCLLRPCELLLCV